MALLEKTREALSERKKIQEELETLIKEAADNNVFFVYTLPSGERMAITSEGMAFPRFLFRPKIIGMEELLSLPFPEHHIWKQVIKITKGTPTIQIVTGKARF